MEDYLLIISDRALIISAEDILLQRAYSAAIAALTALLPALSSSSSIAPTLRDSPALSKELFPDIHRLN